MKNVLIRELKRDDMPRMGRLLQTREGLDREEAEKRKQLMEWVAFKNPFANGEPTYFVAESGEDIVANLGRMPSEFVVDGKIKRGYFIHDLYVDPEYRKMGMGLFLSTALYKAAEESSKSLCCLIWTTPLNLEIQRRRGYHELWGDRYIKLLNARVKLRNFFGYAKLKKSLRIQKYAEKLGSSSEEKTADRKTSILRSIINISNQLVGTLVISAEPILDRFFPYTVKISRIDWFDSRFDDLNTKIIPKLGISGLKTSAYLNWKFIDRPFRTSTVFAAEEDGQLLGYIVVAIRTQSDPPEGTIVTIMANPEDNRTISSLIKAAIQYLKERGAFSIECCLTDKRFLRSLRKFLFFRAARREPIMLANLGKDEQREYLIDIENWHLTYGDSDDFMLVP